MVDHWRRCQIVLAANLISGFTLYPIVILITSVPLLSDFITAMTHHAAANYKQVPFYYQILTKPTPEITTSTQNNYM